MSQAWTPFSESAVAEHTLSYEALGGRDVHEAERLIATQTRRRW
jgi:hypothetical protein